MKNTGKGETSVVEQTKVDQPAEITNRNDVNRLENMKEGQKLKISTIDAPLYKNVKGYFTPYILEDTLTELKLKKGDIVTYKGKYEKDENSITKNVTVYIEVKIDDGTEGYLRLSSVIAFSEDTPLGKEENNSNSRINRLAKVTSRTGTEEKKIGQDSENYVVAIAAGRNNGYDKGITNEGKGLKEEELTIKVAERVEELLKDYTNIKVIQTGSTSKNPSEVEPEDRAKKTRDANPNLCIQIYFSDGNTPGVQTIYRQGDNISQQLAEILSTNLANIMGLTDLKAGADVDKCKNSNGISSSLSIIENAAITGYPSVVAMGGNLNKDPDASVISDGGVEKYAQAIVKSIDGYFKADKEGRISTENSKTTYKDSTESKIINMKYVKKEQLQKYIDDGDVGNALKSYTIDDDKNIVIVSWTRNKDGSLELKTNNSLNLKTALQKYVMPYEYLLYFYMDTYYTKFSEDLADEVMNSEIVIAVQDNITTTNTIDTTTQRKDATVDRFDEDSHETNKVNTTVENVSTSVNVTYVSTWCVKAYQENSYSKAVLDMGNEDEKILIVPGKVSETNSNSSTSEKTVETGTGTYNEITVDANGNEQIEERKYNYTVYEKVVSQTHTISNSYEKGELKTEGRENVFVNLYLKHHMQSKVRTSGYLFQIIEDNEKTANYLSLTKYLIYKATKVPWGVLEYNYEGEFALSSFSSASGIYGGTIQEKVWFALRDLGYSEIAVAGAMGNIDYESGGFNPAIVEGGSGEGIGIVQWSFTRKAQLIAYAASKGLTWQDEDTQVEFLVAEISGQGVASGYSEHRTSGSIRDEGIISTSNDWANASNIEDATIYFMRFFESPGDRSSYNERVVRAQKYYTEFQGKTKPAGDARIGTIKLTGDSANKMTQLLNEAVRIAEDDRYTYSMGNRYGQFQYDCSSLVARLYSKYFGFVAPNTTSEYGSAYYVGSPTSVDLQPGDVVWRPGHVELYIGNGQTVGAHTNEVAGPDQISVVPMGQYTKVYRFITN